MEKKIACGHGAPSILFAGDSELIVGDKNLTRYSLQTGKSRVLAVNTGFIDALALDSRHRRIAALTFGDTIEVRSTADGRLEKRIHRGKGYPVSLAWSGNGRYIACELCANHKAADPDLYTRLQVFDTVANRRVELRQLKDSEIGDISFEPFTSRLFMSSNNGTSTQPVPPVFLRTTRRI